jgi:hypothetical protein
MKHRLCTAALVTVALAALAPGLASATATPQDTASPTPLRHDIVFTRFLPGSETGDAYRVAAGRPATTSSSCAPTVPSAAPAISGPWTSTARTWRRSPTTRAGTATPYWRSPARRDPARSGWAGGKRPLRHTFRSSESRSLGALSNPFSTCKNPTNGVRHVQP